MLHLARICFGKTDVKFEIKNNNLPKSTASNGASLTIGSIETIIRSNICSNFPNFREEERLCYICCKNSPSMIFMNCGHGGTCLPCTLTLLRDKNECAECRSKIETLYKIDHESADSNLVRAIELDHTIIETLNL